MKSVVIGASAGVGRALAEQLAARGDELVITARDPRDLEALAADFRIRFDIPVHIFSDDIADSEPARLRDFIAAHLGHIDALFVIAGMTARTDNGAMDDLALQAVIRTNFTGPVRVVNSLLALCGPQSDIVAAGSVAVMRARGSNVVYSSAKIALENYCMAIRHAYASRLRSVRCYRLGYIRTSMTFGQSMPLPAAEPGAVAARMIRGLGTSGVRYFPAWWALIALCLNMTPWVIFKKLRI